MPTELVSMKMDAAERKEMTEPSKPEGPMYPWGLSLTLNTEALEKLGIDKLPQVGDEFMLLAKVTVSSASARESEYGSSKDVGLQITACCLEALGETEDKVASKLYDGAMAEA